MLYNMHNLGLGYVLCRVKFDAWCHIEYIGLPLWIFAGESNFEVIFDKVPMVRF